MIKNITCGNCNHEIVCSIWKNLNDAATRNCWSVEDYSAFAQALREVTTEHCKCYEVCS